MGVLKQFKQMLEYIHFGEEDFLYMIGDAVDRGEEPIPLLQYIMRQPNMELLMGNHEQGFLWNVDVNTSALSDSEVRRFWLEHGGRETYLQYMELSEKERRRWLSTSGSGRCIKSSGKIFSSMPEFLRRVFVITLWRN